MEWGPSTRLGAYDADAIRRLKDETDGDLYVSGSGTLVRGLLADGLVDELHLFVYPIALGGGQRLWDDGGEPTRLALVGHDVYDNGVVHLAYAMLDQHLEAGLGIEAARARRAHQRRRLVAQQDVEQRRVRLHARDVDRQRIVGLESERGGVDDQVVAGRVAAVDRHRGGVEEGVELGRDAGRLAGRCRGRRCARRR